jgi:hypothetical protein
MQNQIINNKIEPFDIVLRWSKEKLPLVAYTFSFKTLRTKETKIAQALDIEKPFLVEESLTSLIPVHTFSVGVILRESAIGRKRIKYDPTLAGIIKPVLKDQLLAKYSSKAGFTLRVEDLPNNKAIGVFLSQDCPEEKINQSDVQIKLLRKALFNILEINK